MVSRIEKRWALLTFIALGVLVLFFASSRPGSPVSAQTEVPAPASLDASRSGGQTGSNGEILVVPIQIERDRYGLAMVDTVGQTLWIYELNNVGPAHSRLRLLAARSWQYDRMLKQYNTAEPKPEQVKILLEEQVQEQQTGSDVNAVEANVVEANEPNK
jgi:hypothetical protein